MHLRLAFVAISVCAAGCAAPEQQTAPASAARPQPEPRYVTGSRVPLRESDEGSQSVSGISKDAYEDEMRRMATPTSGR